jgi:hypothetical protein
VARHDARGVILLRSPTTRGSTGACSCCCGTWPTAGVAWRPTGSTCRYG